jgi:fructose-bisphosphate aldolase class II
MKEILDQAKAGGYGVVAPNISSEWDARICIKVAEDLNAPLILDVGFAANPDIYYFGRILTDLCVRSSAPLAVNLDHGAAYAHIVAAIRAGFTSVMADRSMLPYEQNVATVKEIVKIAHAVGVSVEAELGHVGSGENYAVDGNTAFTDPDEAVGYVEETGIDCLAVAIGTAHGAYIGTPVLRFELLEKLAAKVPVPLVLHGGSGSGDENLRKACAMGINKVNISNDLMRSAYNKIMEKPLDGNLVYGLYKLAGEGLYNRLAELARIFGSEGKAWTKEQGFCFDDTPRADDLVATHN